MKTTYFFMTKTGSQTASPAQYAAHAGVPIIGLVHGLVVFLQQRVILAGARSKKVSQVAYKFSLPRLCSVALGFSLERIIFNLLLLIVSTYCVGFTKAYFSQVPRPHARSKLAQAAG